MINKTYHSIPWPLDGWDVWNEILHDRDYFLQRFGQGTELFEEFIQEYKRIHPEGRAVINDYELTRNGQTIFSPFKL